MSKILNALRFIVALALVIAAAPFALVAIVLGGFALAVVALWTLIYWLYGDK